MSNAKLVLSVIATDKTFKLFTYRNKEMWQGKCIFCNTKITVGKDGTTDATIEHILSRHHGGTNDLNNLALACASCNHEKGIRHDNKKRLDSRAQEVVTKLLDKRKQRWRDA